MVANSVDAAGLAPATTSFARLADRWIYVFMAALFVVTTLVGFIPDSFGLVASVTAGQRPPLPPILHVHAVLMGSWLLLLLTQSTLVATGRSALHKQLGLVGMVLAPAIVVAMIGIMRASWSEVAAIPAGAMTPESLAETKTLLANLALGQGRVILFFAVFVGWALSVRKSDPQSHKRLLILATAMPLPAAIDRMTWLYSSLPDSPTTVHLDTLLWLLPALLYDVARRGSVHRAYVIGIALNVPFVVATHLLWGSPWWLATAPRLLRVPGW
jgi:hypothetical protein